MKKGKNTDKGNALKEITERLEAGVKEVFTSSKFTEYLTVMCRFHRYSFNNQILIFMQMPESTYVAGFKAWQEKFHRHVKSGEHGIKILAPSSKLVEVETDEIDQSTGDKKTKEYKLTRFFPVTVFDVSQTEGEPLPSLCKDLTGEVENFDKMFSAIQATTSAPMSFVEIKDDAKGWYRRGEHIIGIKKGLPEMQTIKTAIHEAAHSLLHNEEKMKEAPKDRETKEVEAESVAYVVSQYFGLDTQDYSFGYIAGWGTGKETKELKTSLEDIRATAMFMIDVIEHELTADTKVAA